MFFLFLIFSANLQYAFLDEYIPLPYITYFLMSISSFLMPRSLLVEREIKETFLTLLTVKHAGVSTSKKGEESRNQKTLSEARLEERPEDVKQGSLAVEAAQPERQTKGEKTLKDAVKPKHNRKKKQSSAAAS
ncbi:hypothetical protein PanWU01x14_162110 [Parasponia andersonii]|uniref:Uncharacterized protein n=1 Tax=Parasponia andersonii TaxID=3476 RepID=A0A2P5CDG5_PARAD|nr:hypothetical protein PanWU01x14_162110 [Parasponia andersonii]